MEPPQIVECERREVTEWLKTLGNNGDFFFFSMLKLIELTILEKKKTATSR